MWAFDETVDVAPDIQIALELRAELHGTVKAAEKVACVGRGSDSFMGMRSEMHELCKKTKDYVRVQFSGLGNSTFCPQSCPVMFG